jgi:hypothetical protein
MFRLLAHHLHASKLSLFLSLPACVSTVELSGGKGEKEGMGEEPNYTTAKKPGPLLIIQYSLCHAH